MENIRIKGFALILSFLLLPVLASTQTHATSPAKNVKKKTTAHKASSSRSKAGAASRKSVAAKKPAATHTTTVHRLTARAATGVAVKRAVRTSTGSAAARRPRVPWKEVIDRASKGNSEEGDDLNGEDPAVRAAAVEALGSLNGSVVVSDPKSGRILSIVNQRLAFSSGEQPCSTIKLPVALAALSEGLINRDTQVHLNRRLSMNLVEAIAHSNNPFFENLGSRMGFEKVEQYETQFGFGELAGYHIPQDQLGTLPPQPPAYGGVARMSSFGMEVSVTPLQLAAFVSAIGNGGTLYYLQRPKTAEEQESFQPVIKRHLEVQSQIGRAHV